MSSYRQLYYHVTFGTFERRPILLPERREEFLRYSWGVVNGMKSRLYRIPVDRIRTESAGTPQNDLVSGRIPAAVG
jgi:hypothetical protein